MMRNEFAHLLYCCEFLVLYVTVKKQACVALEYLSPLCEGIPFGLWSGLFMFVEDFLQSIRTEVVVGQDRVP